MLAAQLPSSRGRAEQEAKTYVFYYSPHTISANVLGNIGQTILLPQSGRLCSSQLLLTELTVHIQAMVEDLLKEYPNALILRVRMPIVADLLYPRNFITKIIKYDKVRELHSYRNLVSRMHV